MRQSDEQGLVNLFQSLSEEARCQRFFGPIKDGALEAEAHREANLAGTFALIAVNGVEERVVGHAFYATLNKTRAEVAFTIADEFRGRGLATILLGQLADVAAANGIQVFEAEVLGSNQAMLNVFRESGFPIEVSATVGQLHVVFPTTLTATAIERFEHREALAAVNALNSFFKPSAIAVIGASRKRGSIGAEIFRNLLRYGFEGPVYPVNPSASVIQSVPAYSTIAEINGPVDLAVIVVPAEQVIEAAASCARKGVKALVVISAGFAETGELGQRRQNELLKVCRDAGMRLIGPNCMGIANTNEEVRLDATFAPTEPTAGRVGFSSQSGALGLAILDYAESLGLGLSTFVSVGNKADISGNDLLHYWEADEGTDVILLYLESFGNPKKFSRIARRVGQKKPIAVVKSGRSSAGARATSSHTGALIAASDVTVDALFRQSGVIRTDTLEELFDVASLLANQPLPAGKRVGIITNAGGPGILCADACEARGIQIPLLNEEKQQKLRQRLGPSASTANPVDLIASATADHYRFAIETVAADENIDAIIVIFTPPLSTRAEDVATAIMEQTQKLERSKPVLSVFVSPQPAPPQLTSDNLRIPCYRFPETAAIALARAARYQEWRTKPESPVPHFDDLKQDDAAAIVASALLRGPGWLTPKETSSLLACYGLPIVDQRIVNTPEEAARISAAMNCKVALKAMGPNLIHKTESNAVQLNLSGAEEVRAAAQSMLDHLNRLGKTPVDLVVQPMLTGGVEMLVGVVHDPQFGPVVACGAGGTQVELFRDVSIRLTPLATADASEMIRELKTYPLLNGFRGKPSCDVAALEDGLLRLSAMVDDIPQIVEMDCNPFLVLEKGAVILDARIRIATISPTPLFAARRT
jgi:acetyl coenzyme A synthetase (ADP forming)-like protein